jgi:predicted MFS family arabinose efflux permease
VAVVVATVFMVSSSARMVPAQALIVGSTVPAMRGGFMSLNSAVQSAAMGLASLVGGALIHQSADGRLPGYPVVGLVAAGTALMSLVLAGWLQLKDVGPTRVPPPVDAAVAEAVG